MVAANSRLFVHQRHLEDAPPVAYTWRIADIFTNVGSGRDTGFERRGQTVSGSGEWIVFAELNDPTPHQIEA